MGPGGSHDQEQEAGCSLLESQVYAERGNWSTVSLWTLKAHPSHTLPPARLQLLNLPNSATSWGPSIPPPEPMEGHSHFNHHALLNTQQSRGSPWVWDNEWCPWRGTVWELKCANKRERAQTDIFVSPSFPFPERVNSDHSWDFSGFDPNPKGIPYPSGGNLDPRNNE